MSLTHNYYLRITAVVATLVLFAFPATQAHGPADYSALFDEARKSVVSVNSLTLQDRRRQQRNFPFPFPFPFPDQQPQQPGRNQQPDSPFRAFGFGSGFILDTEGHILTNAHVILQDKTTVVDNVEIRMYDKKTYHAEVLGYDVFTDIALLKIDPAGRQLPVAKIGDSDILKVGQAVLALGHPLSLDYTLTSGIISSLNRSLQGGQTDRHVAFIQTDAVINPGNSGGPLLNTNGEVIGINARIISGRGGSYIGYSLAIPINDAIKVQRALLADGKIERGMIGVTFAGVNDDDAKVWGLDPNRGGVLINSVIEDSGAEAAGLLSGDIILTFDGKQIEDPADFPRYIANTRPGTAVEVLIFREGEEIIKEVTLGSIEDDGHLVVRDSKGNGNSKYQKEPYGMVLKEVSTEMQQRFNIKGGIQLAGFNDRNGEIIIPQELYKLQAGDIILGVIIQGKLQQVDKPRTLRTLLSNLETDTIGFRVIRDRGGRAFFITVNLSN